MSCLLGELATSLEYNWPPATPLVENVVVGDEAVFKWDASFPDDVNIRLSGDCEDSTKDKLVGNETPAIYTFSDEDLNCQDSAEMLFTTSFCEPICLCPVEQIMFKLSSNLDQTVYEWLKNSKHHQILYQHIEDAGLKTALMDPTKTITLFAPTDEAFSETKLDNDNKLLLNNNGYDTRQKLRYHIADGLYRVSDFSTGLVIPTLLGAGSTQQFLTVCKLRSPSNMSL